MLLLFELINNKPIESGGPLFE